MIIALRKHLLCNIFPFRLQITFACANVASPNSFLLPSVPLLNLTVLHFFLVLLYTDALSLYDFFSLNYAIGKPNNTRQSVNSFSIKASDFRSKHKANKTWPS